MSNNIPPDKPSNPTSSDHSPFRLFPLASIGMGKGKIENNGGETGTGSFYEANALLSFGKQDWFFHVRGGLGGYGFNQTNNAEQSGLNYRIGFQLGPWSQFNGNVDFMVRQPLAGYPERESSTAAMSIGLNFGYLPHVVMGPQITWDKNWIGGLQIALKGLSLDGTWHE